MSLRGFGRLATAVVAVVLPVAATAAFPERPITLVVPFSAGGPTDRVARDLGSALGKALRQTIVVENVDGAGGSLGAAKVAKATPDGYTLLLYHIGMATTASLYRSLPFKATEDFEYLGLINEVPMTLIGRPTLPARNYPELLKWMQANEGKVYLANAGLGAASHLCGLLFRQSVGIDMTIVRYKGTGPAMADLLGGQIDLMCDQTTNTTVQIDAGRVKAYAVTTLRPLTTPGLAQLPTLDSQGLRGFNVSVWHGLYAPRGTPAAVTQTLNTALRAALQDPDFVRKQQALGAVIVDDERLAPAAHKAFVAAEIEKWAAAMKAAGQ